MFSSLWFSIYLTLLQKTFSVDLIITKIICDILLRYSVQSSHYCLTNALKAFPQNLIILLKFTIQCIYIYIIYNIIIINITTEFTQIFFEIKTRVLSHYRHPTHTYPPSGCNTSFNWDGYYITRHIKVFRTQNVIYTNCS